MSENEKTPDSNQAPKQSMDSTLKQRLVGATVLVALAVIFVPMLVKKPDTQDDLRDQVSIPAKPGDPYGERLFPLEDEAADKQLAVNQNEPENTGDVLWNEEVLSARKEEANELTRELTQPVNSNIPPVATNIEKQPMPVVVADNIPAPPVVAPVVEKKTTPVIKPAPVPKATGAWAFQLASLGTEKDAQSLVKQLRSKGFSSAHVKRRVAKGQVTYKVRIGPSNLADARNVQKKVAKVKEFEKLGGFILKNAS